MMSLLADGTSCRSWAQSTWADEKQWKHNLFSCILITLLSGVSWAKEAHFLILWMLPQKVQ